MSTLKNICWVAIDDYPAAIDAVRGGYLDGAASNSCWALSDAGAKGMLWHVCLGERVPKLVRIPTFAVTLDNIDTSPYGGPYLWGEMLMYEPDPTKWPILEMEKYGMPTPHFRQQLHTFLVDTK